MRRRSRPSGFQVGERIVIAAGALRGMTGLVQDRGADGRVHVALDESPGTLVRIHVRHVRAERSDPGSQQSSPEARSP